MTPAPTDDLRVILVSLRDPDDPMAAHEARCFRDVCGLGALEVVHARTASLGAAELEADLLLFGGSGAYSVLDRLMWVRRALDFCVQVAEAGVPAWASCFGFQGLALALGGSVVRDDDRQRLGAYEIAITEAGRADPLLGPLAPGCYAQFGHHDYVVRTPSGVTVLASSAWSDCEAFRVDGSNFWGAQFHPELSKTTTFDRWLHYRDHYDGGRAAEIEHTLKTSPETPESEDILRRLVALAREVRAARKG